MPADIYISKIVNQRFNFIHHFHRTPAGSTYRNLAATPVELIRNPMENFNQKPEDKEKLIKHNE